MARACRRFFRGEPETDRPEPEPMEFDRLQRNWQSLAARDPMWAILAEPGTEDRKWDVGEFFATGRLLMAMVQRELQQKQVELAPGRALDFGCGLGRLSQAMAEHFQEVVGVDVAPSMVEGARRHNRFGDRVRYVLNGRPDLSQFDAGSFDFVFTALVLQHMRPDFQSSYLREFVRVLRPGGVVVAHVPVQHKSGRQLSYSAPETAGEARVEMYGQPIPAIEQVLRAAGADVLFSVPDPWSGPNWDSAHYIARRPAG